MLDRKSNKLSPLGALVMGALAVMAQSNVARADDAAGAQKLEKIEVTGSLIRRPELESASPVTMVGSEEFKLQGATNVDTVLQALPQVVPGYTSAYNNGSDGSTQVDLRGLGPQRTLVLVNGRRYLPKDETGTVDLNTVPLALIDHVDVVTGGASATYGSDAMAGVVNFVLKKNFEGAQIDTQTGRTARRDGQTDDISLVAGSNLANGRGNVTVFAGYTKRDGVQQGQRDFSQFALAANSTKTALVPQGSANAFPANTLDGNGNTVHFDGTPGGTYNFNPVNYLQTPQTRYNFGALAHLDLNEHNELFTQLVFSNNRVVTQLAPTPTSFNQFNVNANNPFLPAGAASTLAGYSLANGLSNDPNTTTGLNLDGTIPFLLGRRMLETGNRIQAFERNAFQLTLGARGDFANNWNYETYAQFAHTAYTSNYYGDLNAIRFQQSLLVNPGVNGGAPTCVDPTGGCVPADIFGTNPISGAAANFIKQNMVATGLTTQSIAGASVNGSLPDAFRSPFAKSPIDIAFGAEQRTDRSALSPDDNLATGNLVGFNAVPPVSGSVTVKELFVETAVPLIQDLPYVKRLGMDAGYRHSDYNNSVGVTETYKLGLSWDPIESTTLRGMLQHAVRGPNIGELYSPQSISADSFNDPCAVAPASRSAQLQAICAATGAPNQVAATPAGQGNGLHGGNPQLKAESSDTYTLGVVFQPSRDFSASADLYSIKIKNAVELFGGSASNVLAQCYAQTDPNNIYCQQVHRAPGSGILFGSVGNVAVTNQNVGYLATKGVDVALHYGLKLNEGWGKLAGDVQATFVQKYDLQTVTGGPTLNCAGTFGLICGQPLPKTNVSVRGTWSWHDLVTSLRMRYIDSVDLDAHRFDATKTSPTLTIAAASYFDLSATYKVTKELTVRGGINNLLDKQPPILGSDVQGPSNFGNANTFPGTYDTLGRAYVLGATYTF